MKKSKKPEQPAPEPINLQKAYDCLYRDLAEHGVSTWDMAIYGDGSGSSWGRGAGWASLSVEHETNSIRHWTGAVDSGTVNFAEIMAYLQPLTWLANAEQDRRYEGKRRHVLQVHVFTDSEHVRDMLNRDRGAVKKNILLWAAFDVLARAGITIMGHWIARASSPFNVLCDAVSREARITLEEFDKRAGHIAAAAYPGGEDIW